MFVGNLLQKIFRFYVFFTLHLLDRKRVQGQASIIKVPEGVRDNPTKIAEFPVFFNSDVHCEVVSVDFMPPEGLLTPQTAPKLFGVKLPETSETSTVIKRTVQSTSSSLSQSLSQSPSSNESSKYISTTHTPNSTMFSTPPWSHTTPGVTTLPAATNTTAMDVTSHQTTNSEVVVSSTASVTSPASINVTTPKDESSTTTALVPTLPTAQLLQLIDLDREKADRHFATVHCYDMNGTETGFPQTFVIKVTDVNDNSPVFVKSSLHTVVSTNVTAGDAVMLLKATDADIGLNAELSYDMVKGSVRLQYKNQVDPVHALVLSTLIVLKSGFVVMIDDMSPDVTITFKAVVKDRGNHFDGNRATSTATISFQRNAPDPHPLVPTNQIALWEILVPGLVGLFVMIALIAFIIVRRKRRRNNRALLVIDNTDELDDDEQILDFMP